MKVIFKNGAMTIVPENKDEKFYMETIFDRLIFIYNPDVETDVLGQTIIFQKPKENDNE